MAGPSSISIKLNYRGEKKMVGAASCVRGPQIPGYTRTSRCLHIVVGFVWDPVSIDAVVHKI